MILRATVMDPFLAEEAGPDHVAGLIEALESAAIEALGATDAQAPSDGVSGTPLPGPSGA